MITVPKYEAGVSIIPGSSAMEVTWARPVSAPPAFEPSISILVPAYCGADGSDPPVTVAVSGRPGLLALRGAIDEALMAATVQLTARARGASSDFADADRVVDVTDGVPVVLKDRDAPLDIIFNSKLNEMFLKLRELGYTTRGQTYEVLSAIRSILFSKEST